MNLWSIFFRPWRPITCLDALADFIDEQAAFLVQKGIHEYSRARAGHYAKVLFSEQTFLEALERSRWTAFPLGLAMVAEVATMVLQEKSTLPRQEVVEQVSTVTLRVFDRYPVPGVLDAAVWREARTQLAERLNQIAVHPPKRAMDIPAPMARDYFALMPIHKSLRGQDFPTLKNYLSVTLCNVHDELTRRLDAHTLVGSVGGTAQ